MKALKFLALSLLLSSHIAIADNIRFEESNGYTTAQGSFDTTTDDSKGYLAVYGFGNNIFFLAYDREARINKSCRVYNTEPLWESAKQALIASTGDKISFSFRFKNGESKCSSLHIMSNSN